MAWAERTLFMLDGLDDAVLRRRTNANLNKGEARNALARAVFFNRLGDLRGRGVDVPVAPLAHVAPLGFEHISLTGDYWWSEIDKPR